jgi:hypothetical protein
MTTPNECDDGQLWDLRVSALIKVGCNPLQHSHLLNTEDLHDILRLAYHAGWKARGEVDVVVCDDSAAKHDSCAESAREIGSTDSLRVHACHANACRDLAAEIKKQDSTWDSDG